MRNVFLPPIGSRPSVLRKNLSLCTWEGFVATPLVFLTIPGNIILAALITQVFGVSKPVYGMMVSLPAWFNALQLVIMPFLAARYSTKRLTLFFAWVQLAIWGAFTLVLGLIPPGDAEAAAPFFFITLALSSLLGSVAGVSWTAWVQEFVPQRLRGKYFGRRNRITGLSTIAFLLVSGKLLEVMDASVLSYQILLGGCALLRFISLFWMHSIGDKDEESNAPKPRPSLESFRKMSRHSGFMRFVIFAAFTGFWLSFIGPFVPVYLYEEIGMKVSDLTLLNVIGALSTAVAMPAWGKVVDRHGCKRAIVLSLLLWEVQNLLWVAMRPELAWMLYPMWLWGGAVSAGYVLGTFNMLLKLIPREQRTTGVSINLAVTSGAAAIAPVIAGWLLAWGFNSGIASDLVYRIGFLIKPLAVIGGLLLLRGIREPVEAEINTVLGALRSLRHALLHEGVAFFANFSLARRRKPH